MTGPESRAYVVHDHEGEAVSFLGALMVPKAQGPGTGQRFDLLDQRVPPGYAPPRHRHEREDEAWYVLEGEASFWCGTDRFSAGPGSFVFLPQGVEHAFLAGPDGARLLTLTAPSGFASFVAELGEPATDGSSAAPASIDAHRLAEVAARYGIVVTGPPPR